MNKIIDLAIWKVGTDEGLMVVFRHPVTGHIFKNVNQKRVARFLERLWYTEKYIYGPFLGDEFGIVIKKGG